MAAFMEGRADFHKGGNPPCRVGFSRDFAFLPKIKFLTAQYFERASESPYEPHSR